MENLDHLPGRQSPFSLEFLLQGTALEKLGDHEQLAVGGLAIGEHARDAHVFEFGQDLHLDPEATLQLHLIEMATRF